MTETKHKVDEKGEWILIPGGTALIGANSPGEGPPQLLDIPGFRIGRYPVTNKEFQVFIQNGGYDQPEFWDAEGVAWLQSQKITEPAFWRDTLFNLPSQPVTGVSFYEAQAYACWAGARLPTEMEWEKAARGTQGALYPWGNDEPNASRANFAPGYVPANRSPIPVHECAQGDSSYGCRQMAGNIYEWCVDYFHVDTPARRSPTMLAEIRPSHRRVLKGGSWGTGASRLRASSRWSGPAELRDNVLGFRIACDNNSFALGKGGGV